MASEMIKQWSHDLGGALGVVRLLIRLQSTTVRPERAMGSNKDRGNLGQGVELYCMIRRFSRSYRNTPMSDFYFYHFHVLLSMQHPE